MQFSDSPQLRLFGGSTEIVPGFAARGVASGNSQVDYVKGLRNIFSRKEETKHRQENP
jgi:hypothetical protein